MPKLSRYKLDILLSPGFTRKVSRKTCQPFFDGGG